jgi:DNA-binding GntR family transcriptional regulator
MDVADMAVMAIHPDKLSQSERAYLILRDLLITLQIPPGALIHEEALSRELAIGRTPVHEALKRLALEKLVAVYPRRGTFATDININDLAYISEVRLPLEGLVAAIAAQRATPKELRDLEQILEETDEARGNSGLLDTDIAFHRALYRCTRNPSLEATISQYLNLSLRILHLTLDRLPNLAHHLTEQKELVEALKAGDAERAHDIATQHLSSFGEEMRSVL